MEGLNKIICAANVKNTGICECFFDPKLIDGYILVPKDRVFTETELLDANIQATLEAAIAVSPAGRIYPVNGLVAITDNSEDDVIQTFGYGGQTDAREGDYNWFFQFLNGGLNLSNNLRSFNGLIGKYRVIFTISSQNIMFGTSRKDANGDNGLGGIPLVRLKPGNKWKPADGTNVAQYGSNFSFKAPYINEQIAYKSVSTESYILSELNGLEDIKLAIVEADSAADTVLVRADSDCGSTDLYDLYDDELNQAVAWVVEKADGTAVTITVAKDDDAKAWLLSYTTAEVEDGDTITLAAPAVLGAAPINVVGYEANTVIVSLGS